MSNHLFKFLHRLTFSFCDLKGTIKYPLFYLVFKLYASNTLFISISFEATFSGRQHNRLSWWPHTFYNILFAHNNRHHNLDKRLCAWLKCCLGYIEFHGVPTADDTTTPCYRFRHNFNSLWLILFCENAVQPCIFKVANLVLFAVTKKKAKTL